MPIGNDDGPLDDPHVGIHQHMLEMLLVDSVAGIDGKVDETDDQSNVLLEPIPEHLPNGIGRVLRRDELEQQAGLVLSLNGLEVYLMDVYPPRPLLLVIHILQYPLQGLLGE